MNSNTPPQEILIKVMCSERLPRDDRYYHVEDDYSFYSKKEERWYNSEGRTMYPEYWYEPATRVVLTVEEYERLKERHKQLGYLEAREDMDDERDADELY